MFGLFGLLGGPSMSPEMRREQAARRAEELERRLAGAVGWDPRATKWRRGLALKASTWVLLHLFEVEPSEHENVNEEEDPRRLVISLSGRFAYCEKRLPRGTSLSVYQGSRRGSVVFDDEILVPSLHERLRNDTGWDPQPWMSITPNEVLTQRPGLRAARGHVVIAGLGLGWALVDIFRKRSVTRVTLVEISQELVDWVMPAIAPQLRGLGKDFTTIVGDARDVLYDYTADVAIVDIFPRYGGNRLLTRPPDGHSRFSGAPPKNIPTVWCWGSAELADERERGWGW